MKNITSSLAKTLRRKQTDTERYLWRQLRAKQIKGLKFRRQVPIGPYIVDFVCFEKKLIIECDGGQHSERINEDTKRDTWLQRKGFKVLRFWNNEIIQKRQSVLDHIFQVCDEKSPSPSSPPIKGGENADTIPIQ